MRIFVYNVIWMLHDVLLFFVCLLMWPWCIAFSSTMTEKADANDPFAFHFLGKCFLPNEASLHLYWHHQTQIDEHNLNETFSSEWYVLCLSCFSPFQTLSKVQLITCKFFRPTSFLLQIFKATKFISRLERQNVSNYLHQKQISAHICETLKWK